MLIPSTAVLLIGVLTIAALAATDWYVWGMNMVSNPRRPRHPQPLSGIELVDLALERLIAINKAALPQVAFETAQNRGRLATDPDDGFKRVA